MDSPVFPFRLVIFLDLGRMNITCYENEVTLGQALDKARRGGKQALSMRVLDMAHGGDEGAAAVIRRRRKR